MTRRLVLAVPLAALATSAVLLVPGAGAAATHTQTLRFFDKPASIKLTHADGTVETRSPLPEPRAGDTLDVNSLDFTGDHTSHTKRFTGSTHLRCVFGAGGPPKCESHVAIGSSLLVFTGDPATVSDGTGIYQGATGRVVSSKDVAGEDDASDVVVKVRLAG